jgi:hypothetical protein
LFLSPSDTTKIYGLLEKGFSNKLNVAMYQYESEQIIPFQFRNLNFQPLLPLTPELRRVSRLSGSRRSQVIGYLFQVTIVLG